MGDISDITIGISSGASAPEKLIDVLIRKLVSDPNDTHSEDDGSSEYYTCNLIKTLEVIEEKTRFPLPTI